jgi:hypothetical protein
MQFDIFEICFQFSIQTWKANPRLGRLSSFLRAAKRVLRVAAESNFLVESAKVAKTAWYKFATEASEVKALATA